MFGSSSSPGSGGRGQTAAVAWMRGRNAGRRFRSEAEGDGQVGRPQAKRFPVSSGGRSGSPLTGPAISPEIMRRLAAVHS